MCTGCTLWAALGSTSVHPGNTLGLPDGTPYDRLMAALSVHPEVALGVPYGTPPSVAWVHTEDTTHVH